MTNVTYSYTDYYQAYASNPMFIVVSLIVGALLLAGYWKMFEKAGYAGWKCIIPFYGNYIMYEMAFGKGKGWMFLLVLVPCVGQIFEVIRFFKTATAFGKGVGTGFGLWFLNPVFILILGFGSAEYVGVQS